MFLTPVVEPDKISDIIDLIKKSNQPLTTFFKGMIRGWQKTFLPEMLGKDFDEILRSCLLIFNLTILIEVNLLKIWKIDYTLLVAQKTQEDPLLVAIRQQLANHAIAYQGSDFDQEFFSQKQLRHLAHFLYLETLMKKQAQINIFIQTTMDYRTVQMIKSRLHTIYTPETVKFTSCIQAADMIISDNYQKINFTDHVVLITDLLDPDDWQNVFNRINRINQLIIYRFSTMQAAKD